MRGDFHTADHKFDSDQFYEQVSPIVYAVTGSPESVATTNYLESV